MLKNPQLQISQTCTQGWEGMTPESQGRHCVSCGKIVVDFTKMDDKQILDWFAQHQNGTCGRFSPDQLSRPLDASSDQKPNRWQYWNYLVAGLLFSSEITAQTAPAKIPTTQQISIRRQNKTLLGDTILIVAPPSLPDSIRGRVMDDRGTPISYATVRSNRRWGVQTDGNGYFSIDVASISPGDSLTISAVGFETLRVKPKKLLPTPTGDQVYTLTMSTAVLGEVTVVTHRPKKRRPIADTVSWFKDTLVTIGPAKKLLSVYPNPVVRGNSITLSARIESPGTYTMELLNISGTVLHMEKVERNQKFENMSINLPSNLAPGTYLVRLSHPAIKKLYTTEIIIL